MAAPTRRIGPECMHTRAHARTRDTHAALEVFRTVLMQYTVPLTVHFISKRYAFGFLENWTKRDEGVNLHFRKSKSLLR